MEVSSVLPNQLSTIFPTEIWSHIIGRLDLSATKNFAKTCKHARVLTRTFMSDKAIEGLSYKTLQKYAFSLQPAPPAFFKNKKFVLLAIRLKWKTYEHFPHFHLDSEVAKTAALSSLFSTGSIDKRAAQNLQNIGETPFLTSIGSVAFEKNEPCYTLGTDRTKKFLNSPSIDTSDLWNSTEFILTATCYNVEETLSCLAKKNSPFLQNKEVLIVAVGQQAWTTFKHLRNTSSTLVENMEILFAGVGQSNLSSSDCPQYLRKGHADLATLHHLREINSSLVNNKELLIEEARQQPFGVSNHLVTIKSRWMKDEDLLIAMAETSAFVLCNHLNKVEIPEAKCMTLFIKAARQNPKQLLKHLRQKHSNLVENRDILLSAAHTNPFDVLKHFYKIQSDLWRDTTFMQNMREKSPPTESLKL